jgi:hypothetical protein
MVAANEAGNAPAEAVSTTPPSKAAANTLLIQAGPIVAAVPTPAPAAPAKKTAASVATAPQLCYAGSESFDSVTLTGFPGGDFGALNACYSFSQLDSLSLPAFVAASGAKLYHSAAAGAYWAVASADARQVCTVSTAAPLVRVTSAYVHMRCEYREVVRCSMYATYALS